MNRKKGLVSVVIPYYNHGTYIREAIQSILDQTYCNFEIIIVDDGSDDPASLEILSKISHQKVIILRKENGYVSSARNHGIKHSKGEYILTLDADDMFAPTFLEKAVPILKEGSGIGVVTSHLHTFNHKGFYRIEDPKGGGAEDFLTHNRCNASALFRYQCWVDAGGYNENYDAVNKGFEDWDFWLSVTKKGWIVHSIPECLSWYRDAADSMSDRDAQDKPEMLKRMYIRHREIYQENVVEVLYKKELELLDLRKVKKSYTYRIGRIIIHPIHYLRNQIKNLTQKLAFGDAVKKRLHTYIN